MNRGLLVALIALAFMPATKDLTQNSDARSGGAETSRGAAPAPSTMAQRCFVVNGQLRCF